MTTIKGLKLLDKYGLLEEYTQQLKDGVRMIDADLFEPKTVKNSPKKVIKGQRR